MQFTMYKVKDNKLIKIYHIHARNTVINVTYLFFNRKHIVLWEPEEFGEFDESITC